jgi:hypothetical protein
VHTDVENGQTGLKTSGLYIKGKSSYTVICTANSKKPIEKGGTRNHASSCRMEKPKGLHDRSTLAPNGRKIY